ncbi:MAG: lysylphosphatidylglycerol synthase transmembrane domain-containing protein [Pseudomonadota bacterium]
MASRHLGLGLKLIISAALLLMILSYIPLDELASRLRGLHIRPLLAALSLIPSMVYVAATQTKILSDRQGMTLSVWQIFRISFITNFYSLLLPGQLAGGVVRWYKFSRQDKKPAQALATIVFSRLLSMLISVALGIACWYSDAAARENTLLGVILLLLLLGLVFTYGIFFSGQRALRVAEVLDTRLWIPKFLRSKLGKFLRSAVKFEGLSRGRLLSIIGILLIYHMLGIAIYYLLATAIQLDLSPINVAWVRTYVLLITMIPISVMGMGVRESGLIYLLQTYGISPALAVGFSFLLLGRRLVMVAIGAGFEFWDFLRDKPPSAPGKVS